MKDQEARDDIVYLKKKTKSLEDLVEIDDTKWIQDAHGIYGYPENLPINKVVMAILKHLGIKAILSPPTRETINLIKESETNVNI